MREWVIADVRVIPLGTATPSVSPYIAACLDVIKEAKGISYQLTGMGTIIEGPLAQVLELVQKVHEVPFTKGAQRVVTLISIDDRRDKRVTAEDKVKAVS